MLDWTDIIACQQFNFNESFAGYRDCIVRIAADSASERYNRGQKDRVTPLPPPPVQCCQGIPENILQSKNNL